MSSASDTVASLSLVQALKASVSVRSSGHFKTFCHDTLLWRVVVRQSAGSDLLSQVYLQSGLQSTLDERPLHVRRDKPEAAETSPDARSWLSVTKFAPQCPKVPAIQNLAKVETPAALSLSEWEPEESGSEHRFPLEVCQGSETHLTSLSLFSFFLLLYSHNSVTF